MWPRNARHNAYTGAQLRRGPKPSKTFRLCSRRPENEDLPSGIVDPSAKGTSADARLRRHRFARGLYRLQALHRPRGFRSNSRRVARLQPTTRGPAAQLRGFPGTRTVGPEIAFLDKASGGLVYRVHARDLHLLRGPKDDGSAVHFRITIDGASPGDNHGTDVSADGSGVVLEQRLYQLVRQSRKIGPPHLRDRISRSWRSRLFVHLWLRCRACLAAGRRVHSIPNESAERARDIIAACGPPSRRWRG